MEEEENLDAVDTWKRYKDGDVVDQWIRVARTFTQDVFDILDRRLPLNRRMHSPQMFHARNPGRVGSYFPHAWQLTA